MGPMLLLPLLLPPQTRPVEKIVPLTSDPLTYIATEDGARIAVKRKAAPGTPVIMLHGLSVNADLWDLPDVAGADFHYQSLAKTLHAAGHDVWLVNWRGHGAPHMRSEPAPGQADWCVDHFILYDLPAVVAHVRQETGRRPFIIGASMGSMTLAGYLQGTTLTAAPDGPRIVADPALAACRQAELAGCVFTEFPARLEWPDSAYDRHGQLDWQTLLRDWRRTDGDVNYAFEILSRWGWLQAIVDAVGEIPVHFVKGNPEIEPWYRKLPAPLADLAADLERTAVQGMLNMAGVFTGATHHRAEVMLNGRRYVLDHMKAGVLRQLTKCVRQRQFVSYLGQPDYVYSDHYDLITLPMLVVQGGRDRIANARVTETAFYERVGATDKAWLFDPDIAHGEIEAAPVACERIYPRILAWIAERDRR